MEPLTALAPSLERFVSLLDTHLQPTVDTLIADDYYWATAMAMAVYIGFEVYRILPDLLFYWKKDRIPATKEQTLETLSNLDVTYIVFNKTITIVFTYQFLQYTWVHARWGVPDVHTLVTLPVALAALFIVYDLPYSLFHRALHIQAMYPYIHKHHHRQHAPFRGNLDAINVHPIEYIIGEYNHWLAFHLVNSCVQLHAVAALLFIVVGGFFASLNHTRYNAKLSDLWFAVAAHDSHHRINVQTNYAQYTMLWDYLLGTFLPSPARFVDDEGKKVH